jgi:hypothetical protein
LIDSSQLKAVKAPGVALRAVAALRDALDRTAAALASPRVETLLDCEVAIENALANLPPLEGLDATERAAVRAELDAARRALLRCRRLGAALAEFVRLGLEAQGRGTGYGRNEPVYAGQALDARV